MHTTGSILFTLAMFTPLVTGGELILRNPTGETFGPFAIKEGASIIIDHTSYSLPSITNTPEQRLARRLEGIVIPEVDFKATPLEKAIEFLRSAARKNDPAGEGVTVAYTPRFSWHTTNGTSVVSRDEEPGITFEARNISLHEALKVIANVTDLRLVLRDNVANLLPLHVPFGPMRVRMYNALPGFIQGLIGLASNLADNATGATPQQVQTDLRTALSAFGIPFPRGSSVHWFPQLEKLVMINTEENLKTLEQIVVSMNCMSGQAKLEFFFIAFPTSRTARAESGRQFATEEVLRLWKEGHSRSLANLVLITRTGRQALTKTAWDEVSPTELPLTAPQGTNDLQRMPMTELAATGKLETREVGFIISATPEVSSDGQTIDVDLAARFVEAPTWSERRTTVTPSNAPPVTVSYRQPTFVEHTIDTALSVKSGSTVIVGGGWNLRQTPEVVYLIMKTDLVDPDGRVLPPPNLNAILPSF